VVAKHRRSEGEPSLMSAGAPVAAADDWPEAVGYGQAPGAAWPAGMHSRVIRPAGASYPAPTGYGDTGYDGTGYVDSGYDGAGYGGAAAEPGGAAAPDTDVWQEWQDWRNWGPPPPMHPDHPSAPMAALRDSGPAVLPQRRAEGSARTRSTPSQRSDAGYGNGRPRLHVVPDGEPAGHEATALRTPERPGRPLPVRPPADLAEPDWQGDAFPRHQGLLHRDAVDNQRHAGPGPDPGPDDSRATVSRTAIRCGPPGRFSRSLMARRRRSRKRRRIMPPRSARPRNVRRPRSPSGRPARRMRKPGWRPAGRPRFARPQSARPQRCAPGSKRCSAS